MKKFYVIAALLAVVVSVFTCRKSDPITETISNTNATNEELSAGANTVFSTDGLSFGQPFPGMASADADTFDSGRESFHDNFVALPSQILGGLGPIFINTSCISCHHNDAIGLPTSGDIESSMLVRLSIPGADAHGGPLAIPGYGLQLQNMANFGVQPEGKLQISYSEQSYTFPDGTSYSLRTPSYTLTNLYTPMPADAMISVRLASPMIGLGMLEAVPASEIESFVDAGDSNHDGITGKSNYVYDDASGTMKIGRFGWKANTPTLLTQTAKAFNQDIGCTSVYFPKDNAAGQLQDDHRTAADELPASVVPNVLFYSQTLAVPARRNVNDPTVQRGETLFLQIQCGNCHRQTLTTAPTPSVAHSTNLTIHPYTDLLVHDMGPGLADGRPDFLATGTEWRTAPLWGIGLYDMVNYPACYLHDGRARNLTEAIMWHGGEAQNSKNKFASLSGSDRNAVLAFLNSL